jgi:hypothetical protein
MKLFFTFLQLPRYIARLMDLGEIDLWLDLGGGCFFPSADRARFACKIVPDQGRLIVLDGRRVRLLVLDADVRQRIQNLFAFYLELSGQIIDSNFHALRSLRVFP